jgi:hypothetical protein
VLLAANGCTALQALPPSEYAAQNERRDVVMETVDGERVEFQSIRVQGDTLTGWREKKDTELPLPAKDADGNLIPEPPPLPEERQVMLDRVAKLSVKQVSWKRTSLLFAPVVAGLIVYALTRSAGEEPGPGDDGNEIPPPPGPAR